jgi:hypothetical protein
MSYRKVDPKTLLFSFPAIQSAAKSFPIPDEAYTDARALHSWAQKADISIAATHVVNLVASVIEGTGFSGDATFDLFTALEVWDEQHRKAFEYWLNKAFA